MTSSWLILTIAILLLLSYCIGTRYFYRRYHHILLLPGLLWGVWFSYEYFWIKPWAEEAIVPIRVDLVVIMPTLLFTVILQVLLLGWIYFKSGTSP